MNPKNDRSRQALVATLLALLSSQAFAYDFYKADNESALNVAASWVDSTGTIVAIPPHNNENASPTFYVNSSDNWYWTNRVTAATYSDGVQNVPLGNNIWTKNLIFTDNAVPVVITGTTSLSLTINTGGGIDMSNALQDVTIQTLNTGTATGVRLSASSADCTFSVAAGRTLTFTGAKITVRSSGSNAVVRFPGPGKVVFNDQYQASHAIINGGRVEFNSATGSSRFATVSPNPVSYTDINGGVVMVNNTSGSATGDSIVNVNTGGTLGGAGKITGATNSVVNANSGSTLAPGNDGIGTLSIGKLNLASGSKILFEANSPLDADVLNVSTASGLTLNGGTVSLYNPGTTNPLTALGTFDLIKYTGTLNGALSNLTLDPATQISGRIYTLGLGANGVTLTIATEAAIERSWDVDTSGTWSTAANWSADTLPDAIGTIANITGVAGAVFTAPRTITLDAPRTVGALALASAQPVTLDGSATLTLNNNAASALLNSSGASHLVSAPLALTAGGILADVAASTTLTLAGEVSGTGVGIVKSGAGTLLLTANNTYTGATSVAAGTLLIGNGGTTGSVAGTIATSATLRFNRSDSVALASVISGTGSVEFAGTGDTTLSAANTYSGSTTLSAGTLVLANTNALQNSTLTYSTTGGALTVADPVVALTLGGLAGDRGLPLTNTLGTPLALSVGQNNSTTTYSGSPSSSGASLTKVGTGTLTLTGTHTYTGATTISNGTLEIGTGSTFNTTAATLGTGTAARLLVSGGTLNSSAASLLTNASIGFEVTGGIANFNGGITPESSNSAAEPFIKVTGGTLNASSISLSRGSLNTGSEPTIGQTGQGLYLNGALASINVTGALGIGAVSGANSSVSARIDAGTLTVGGALTVGINNSAGQTRWSVFDVNGGTLNSTDATTGILLGGAGPGASYTTLLVRNAGAIANTQRIQFGQGVIPGTSTLSLSAGSLYVGSGGMVLGSSEPTFTAALKLNGGTLGASANWSTTIPVSINGFPATVTGSDASDTPHTIDLQGAATGLGALTKNGSGTVLLSSPANSYFGPTIVNGGTLGLAGLTTDLVTVNTGATLAPQGILTAELGGTINGSLAIGYNAAAPTPVSGIISTFGGITLGAGSTLSISGTGILPGPAYVLIKAVGGVTGTFGTVTGLPAGFTLNYAYDDDNDGNTAPVLAMVGSGVVSNPYDTWTASFSLTGNAALTSADPDGDGLVNLLEYALGTSPIVSDASSAYTLGRSGNFLTIGFNHPADSSLTYTIEGSSDLTGIWTTVNTFAPFTTAGAASYTDTTADLTVTPRRFLRIKVTK
jgi:autotransporter-associated beta strand protein